MSSPASLSAGARPRGINFHDRVTVFGRSGSGKSELLNVIAAGAKCQRILVDTKDEFTVDGVDPVYRPEDIDWDQPLIHIIDGDCTAKSIEATFQTIWQHRRGRAAAPYSIVIIVHELSDLCEEQPNRTPRHVSKIAKQGRNQGVVIFGASQRLVGMPRACRTEIQHSMTFPDLDPEDLEIAAKVHRIPLREFERVLGDHRARYGKHGYIWTDLGTGASMLMPPLPDHLRARAIARGIDPADMTTPRRPSGGPDAE